MTFFKLLKNNLHHYRPTNLAIMAGCALSAAILVGALLLGDSVRFSLWKMVDDRLGDTAIALDARDRFFRHELAGLLEEDLGTPTCALFSLEGSISRFDGSGTVNGVNILGVDEGFWSMAPRPQTINLSDDEIALNQRLADRLGIQAGDEVLIYVIKPGFMPRESPLAQISDMTVSFRPRVKQILSVNQFGRFSLRANQVAPYNAFIRRDILSEKIELADRSNLMLVGSMTESDDPLAAARQSLQANWSYADLGLYFLQTDNSNYWELRSNRIFLEDRIAQTAEESAEQPTGIFGYFVNRIQHGSNTTPYSIVAALEKTDYTNPLLPADMQDDEIIINKWLAEDLDAGSGDRLTLRFYVSRGMRELEEKEAMFTVRSVTAMTGLAADPNLMPDFPGLSDVENCRDWDPGIPIDLSAIRDKDETYWNRHRGTPKAFITLAAGQKHWQNRFGSLTAIRLPESDKEILTINLTQKLQPAQMGLIFQPVRRMGEIAGREAMDFSQLFLGLSFFLIVASLLLTALLFALGIEHRTSEAGLLRAVGWNMQRIRTLWLAEAGLIAVVGALAGIVLGIVYTKTMLWALATMWQEAVGSTTIHFFWTFPSIFIGFLAGILLTVFIIWIVLIKKSRQPVHALLRHQKAGTQPGVKAKSDLPFEKMIALLSLFAGGAAIAAGLLYPALSTGMFFLGGAFLLAAFIAAAAAFLKPGESTPTDLALNLMKLAWKNCIRRRGRILAVIAILACGCFLVVAVGVNRRDPLSNADQRSSGTGGFELWASSAMPLYYDLNDPEDQKELGLEDIMTNTRVVPMRVREGDDATCLNINRVKQPRVLGIDPKHLSELNAFIFGNTLARLDSEQVKSPWLLLNSPLETDVIPGIADASSIQWSMGKKLGDTIDYTNDAGETIRIRLVAALQNSILQGSVLISENHFIKHFPGSTGYQRFLIDCPTEQKEKLTDNLGRVFRRQGLTVIPATERLATLYAMEHTYLSMFQLLGGLGLILGCAGLGIIVLRNILERKSELAMLQALGFRKQQIKTLLIREHLIGLILGIVGGCMTALPAVLPTLFRSGGQTAWGQLILTVVSILIFGIIWIWVATSFALREKLLDALRNE